MLKGVLVTVVGFTFLTTAAHAGPLGPSADELWNGLIDPDAQYQVRVSPPLWVVPGPASAQHLWIGPANNNLSLAIHGGRVFLAWRTAPTHFASSSSRIHVVSSPTAEGPWTAETTIALGRDVREPFLLSVGSRLFLYFAELGSSAYRVEPNALLRIERLGPRQWTTAEVWGGAGEVAWDFKVRRGRAWMTSYRGGVYGLRQSDIALRFRTSTDGVRWEDLPAEGAAVYHGGVSEAAFEFDDRGRLWAVTRNERGDESGFGSHLVTAAAETPWRWTFPERSSPERHDSPRLFRYGKDLYLIARRDPVAVFDWGGPSWPRLFHRLILLASYSLRPKRTSLYRIDTETRQIQPLLDLPGVGDTAFPSVVRTGPHELLVANYTSPRLLSGAPWIAGQLFPAGTAIYLVKLRFEPTS
jgi:hypothetical protein